VFKLTIEDDEGKTTVVPLARDEITIGRLEGNTIRLTERNVSRRHARLVRQNGALYIEDLSSFNGVRVNGAKIGSATPLREGDEVQIGDYRLALRGERTTAPITDRPTMPSIAAVAPPPAAPMGTVGGSVVIPTRASVAAMAAQPALAPAVAPPAASGGTLPPLPVGPVAPAASGPSSPSATITQPGPAVRKSPPSPHPVASPSPSPSPQPFAAVPAVAQSAPALKAAPPAAQPPPGKPPQQAVASRPAAAPEVSEAQPTIPIRALGDTVPDPTATGAAARLVVITTDLQGMEFELDRPSVVVGRTDENDIVLPHRSISRHHAKIVRDGEHHTIVDLQSANGVRVNSEDYERIELNPGDVVELGHVKLRFVGALEDYVFKPDAGGGGPVKLKLGAVGLGLVGLATIALVLYRKAPSPSDSAAAAPIAAQTPATATTPSPPAPEEPTAAPPATAPAAILAEARQAVAAEDWEKSKMALDRMSPTVDDPGIRREALALRQRVDTEIQASAQFAQFDEASDAKNYAEAVARYEQIPLESIYKRRARPRYDEARTLLVAEHMATADKLRAAGKCAEVRTEVAEVMRLEPRNLLARDLVRLCKPKQEVAVAKAVKEVAPAPPVAARLARPRPSAPIAAAEAPSRSEPPAARPRTELAAADVDAADADVLMKQAREAWLRQQCGSAVDLSRKALHAKPGMTDAYQIIAVCSCTLKDADAAGRAYAKLDDKNRSLVRQLCQKNGISVGD
jgi:pSer/pThr/pTyr-binding forkhead associated (FHA) protein